MDWIEFQKLMTRQRLKEEECILCAAIHYDNGLVYNFHYNYGVKTGFVLCGYRHPHIISVLPTNPYWLERKFDDGDKEVIQKYEELKVKYDWQENSLTRCNTIQGFITNKGRFVNRKEAFQIALAAGQIDEDAGVNKEIINKACQPEGDKVLYQFPTKTGIHLVTKPFNRNEFDNIMNKAVEVGNFIDIDIPEIKKNHLTLLYENI